MSRMSSHDPSHHGSIRLKRSRPGTRIQSASHQHQLPRRIRTLSLQTDSRLSIRRNGTASIDRTDVTRASLNLTIAIISTRSQAATDRILPTESIVGTGVGGREAEAVGVILAVEELPTDFSIARGVGADPTLAGSRRAHRTTSSTVVRITGDVCCATRHRRGRGGCSIAVGPGCWNRRRSDRR